MKMEPKPVAVNAKILKRGKTKCLSFRLVHVFVARDCTLFMLSSVHFVNNLYTPLLLDCTICCYTVHLDALYALLLYFVHCFKSYTHCLHILQELLLSSWICCIEFVLVKCHCCRILSLCCWYFLGSFNSVLCLDLFAQLLCFAQCSL